MTDRLVAYLHLRRGTTMQARRVLEGHVRAFADREGYDLCRLLVGCEDSGDLLSLRGLVDHVRETDSQNVLVVGPARQALVSLPQLCGVKVVTLATVRRFDKPPPSSRSATGQRHRGWPLWA